MKEVEQVQVSLTPYEKEAINTYHDLDRIIFDLDSQIELLSSQADKLDYLVSIASGLICGALDILWVGDFDLERGRDFASDKIDGFVKKTAKILGCKDDDLESCVKFLEKKFPIPADGNTPDFGGGLQHHLRDFAHHPTLVGLIFSLLTQFTYKSYGTDVNGIFLVADVPEKSKKFIGKDVPTKIFYGTIIWFFHLVSDVAGSSSTTGKSGGTGIPGPILALAKELSVLPVFKSISIGENSLSKFLSKLFNGTLLAKRDKYGKIIKESVLKFDLRGELGLAVELGRQAVPVIANDCIVRCFYFIRRLAVEIRVNDVRSLDDMRQISWDTVKPLNNPTIARMLTIATGVFTTVDVGAAIISQKYWVSVNYVGVGRFSVAIGQDVAWCLKARNVKKIKQMYEDIKRFAYVKEDDNLYKRIGSDMLDIDRFGLTLEQTVILYNLEYHKTRNDIELTKLPIGNEAIKLLKQDWLSEWKKYMTENFAGFIQVSGAELNWYSEHELLEKIEENDPEDTWFRLVLLETMLFEPYYPLSLEKDKKGNDIPSKKYKDLQNAISGYKKSDGDDYLDKLFAEKHYYAKGYIKRLRKCFDKVIRKLNEVLKTVITSLSVTAIIAIIAIATAGAFAPSIAVALVGSNFAGLNGAALTSACLAYLGGGAIAVGGAGMAGGTMAIVGGSVVLGLGVGAGVGGAIGAVSLLDKKNTILQSAKLLVSIREIFLNDEHDLTYSNSIYEKYVQNIIEVEKGIVELKVQADVASDKEKKELKAKIKKAEESVQAMKIARKSMIKYISSFEVGLKQEQSNSDEN
ncbi:MAG: hypothetical protein ACOX3H_05635 [Saccharofermentanales bacterium]